LLFGWTSSSPEQGVSVRSSLRSDRGITIIETTVMLSVLFVLAGAMSPIIADSVNTARAVKAKNDAAMVATGLLNFQKDVGADALAIGAATAVAQSLGLPDVLESEGTVPATESANEDDLVDVVASTSATALIASPAQAASVRTNRALRRAQRRRWREVAAGSLDDHLTTNRRGYRERRPGEYAGWAGPYISAHVSGDPWGNQYMINSRWLDGGSTPADSQGRTRRAVFVVSAGNNGVIETPFDQPITDAQAYGDDIVIRIQ
jgi:type II secretory pathway pseudopilin PulG